MENDQSTEHSKQPVSKATEKRNHPLGLAGHSARFFIDSALTPLLLLSSLAIGIVGLLFTPREEDPQISVPMIDVFVELPGASSEQVVRLVTKPLERVMSEIKGIKHIYSRSQRGSALVTVRFQVGEDLQQSLVKLYDQLESHKDEMPPGANPPLVKPKSVDDVPVVTLTLSSSEVKDPALRSLALDILQVLNRIPETGPAFIVGGRPDRIRVDVNPERLGGYGITLEQIAGTIRSANQENRVGRGELGKDSYRMYSGSYLNSARDVGALVLRTQDNQSVYLKDIADVRQGPAETWQVVEHFTGPAYTGNHPVPNGEPAVTIAVAKQKDTNGVEVAEQILQTMENLQGWMIPNSVQLTVTRNYGKTANQKVNELLLGLLQAAIAVSLLSWFFLGSRPAIVVIVIIPIVVLVTVTSAWLLGYTINRVSLFALVFAIGILVDDATVVVENIYRRWLTDGATSAEIAVDAVREVGNPTIIATFAVLAALLPMAFVSGMMGPYMEPIPILSSVAMLFSLFAAFVFAPWLIKRLQPRRKVLHRQSEREKATRQRIHHYYRPLLTPLLEHRVYAWIFGGIVVLLFFLALSLFLTRAVTVKMLPKDDKPEFNVIINMPEGTALTETATVTRKLATQLREIAEIRGFQTYAGTVSPFNFNGMVRHYYLRDKPWQADIQIQLLDKDKRERSSTEIARQTRDLLTPLAQEAGARIAVVEMPPGPPVLQTLVAEVYAPTTELRREITQDLTQVFEQAPNIVDVDNYLQAPWQVVHFSVDTEKATRHGVSVQAINHNLDMALGGFKVGDVKQGKALEPIAIVLQVPLAVRSRPEQLRDLPIPSKHGGTLPLSELGTFQYIQQDPLIYRKDLRPMEYVVGNMEGRLGAPIYGMIAVENALEDYRAPDGSQISGTLVGPPEDLSRPGFEWTGEWTVTYETFRDLGLAFLAALALIYILIVAEFNDFVLPFVVMLPIPLTLIGIVPGHWLLDAQFTATSIIGFIALGGILVRNSILLVDFARNAVNQDIKLKEAVLQASETRMRPVVITDLTMMVSALALIFDPIFQGMAVSLLFGPIAATTLTFVVVPLGCITASKHLRTEPAVPHSEPA